MSLSDCRVTAVVPVSDLTSAAEFYEDTLGLRRKAKRDYEILYEGAEGSSLQVYMSPSGSGTSSATVVTWEVPDIDVEVRRLREAGVEFEDYDFPEFRTVDGVLTDEDGAKAAWFKDPDGNILCLHQVAL